VAEVKRHTLTIPQKEEFAAIYSRIASENTANGGGPVAA
jgi:hypothetical protein